MSCCRLHAIPDQHVFIRCLQFFLDNLGSFSNLFQHLYFAEQMIEEYDNESIFLTVHVALQGHADDFLLFCTCRVPRSCCRAIRWLWNTELFIAIPGSCVVSDIIWTMTFTLGAVQLQQASENWKIDICSATSSTLKNFEANIFPNAP